MVSRPGEWSRWRWLGSPLMFCRCRDHRRGEGSRPVPESMKPGHVECCAASLGVGGWSSGEPDQVGEGVSVGLAGLPCGGRDGDGQAGGRPPRKRTWRWASP